MSSTAAGERKASASASALAPPSASLGRSARASTPRVADLASTPESPRSTALRASSSLYNSPGPGFRSEDDYVVFEVGARFLRGGFPGESAPRCTLPFSPDRQRRAGDYRQWDPAYNRRRHKPKQSLGWGADHELYRLDLTNVDLRLVQDKLERALRETYTKHFLLDTKPRRISLAIPPRMPHPLITTILDVLFTGFHAPSITMMSSPVLATVAAGLRSALVIDIGWAETLVTAVCEYREVQEKRTVRAGRALSQEMAVMLNAELDNHVEPGAPRSDVSFEEADEVVTRVGWCKPQSRSKRATIYFPAREAPILEEFEDAIETPPPTVTIPFPKHEPPTTIKVPFASLAKPAEDALFVPDAPLNEFDDHDLPIHHLVYRTLVALPIDVRRLCMSRIIITGGVSNMPGLKTRIIKELEMLVQSKGWDPVKSWGKGIGRHEERRQQGQQRWEVRQQTGDDQTPAPGASIADRHPVSAAMQEPEEDAIDVKLAQTSLRNGPPPACSVGGTIRGVETLGAWAGASLVAQQRIRGIVEIERERYLQHGLQGASREKEVSVIPQRQSMGPGAVRGAGERVSWTLGVWA
jgi:actin-related protein